VSYTLRGRIDSRLATLFPIVAASCALALLEHRWWPVEAAGLMLGIGLVLDTQVYDRLLAYQPGWAAVPIGLLELVLLLGLMRLAGVAAPLDQAIALYAGGWATAQLLGHAGFPLVRLGYAEDGGELGRVGLTAAVLVGATLAGAGATAYALRPPVVHLAAGVHQGPLVITRREVLTGDPGAVVRGGIVVRASGVTIRNVSVVGGQYGIAAVGVRNTTLDRVTVSGAKLDGIHVRLGGVKIEHCRVDMLGNPLGQGIDISYTMDMGMTMVDGCTVVGGMEGITTHSSMAEIAHNEVSRTTMRAISVTEMSMSSVKSNEVRDFRGIGIWCNDRSICAIERNTVLGPGYGVLASFESEADLRANHVARVAAQTESLVSYR
jgi:Right handed beta helix region